MSQEGDNNRLTSADVLAEGRRTVTLLSGKTVLIRRPPLGRLLAIVGGIPDVAALAEGVKEGRVNPSEVSVLADKAEQIIIAVCVEPRFYDDPAKGPTPADLSIQDQRTIADAAMELAGLREAAADVLPTAGGPT